jgi:hypothetical protein
MNEVFQPELVSPILRVVVNFPLLSFLITTPVFSHEPNRNQRVLYLPKLSHRLRHVSKDKADIQVLEFEISHFYAPSKTINKMDMTDPLSGYNSNALKRLHIIIKYLYVSTSTDPSSASIPESGTVSQRCHPITTLLVHPYIQKG